MATQTKDYYSTLGIKKSATSDEIRKAFRKLARKYHPDVNPGDKKAEERFKEISEANDVLSDEKKRKIYDQLGFYSDNIDPAAAEAAARGGYGGGFPGAGAGGTRARGGGAGGSLRLRRLRLLRLPGRRRPHTRHTAADGRRRRLRLAPSATSSAACSPAGPARRRRNPGPQPGTDLEYQVQVDFWTAIRGGQVKLEIQRQEVCPTCKGKSTTGGATSAPSATAPARSPRWAAA